MDIAIGPITRFPSWAWIGQDTAMELSKYYSVHTFGSFGAIPKCSIVIVVKQLPPLSTVERNRTIYCPVDIFEDENHVLENMPMLQKCAMILSHSRRLIPLLPRAKEIDHHLKFKTRTISEYKKQGSILWSGGYAHAPYLFKYMETHDFPFKVKILTNYNNQEEVNAAIICADGIGTNLVFKNSGNIEFELWSEKRQNEVIGEAKAAIDIKGGSFNQQYKPPTKAQKYMCAGLPTALNKNSESYEYASSHGLNVPEPDNFEYWFSREYYEENKKVAEQLREKLSLESIGLEYKRHIECILRE